MSDAPKQDWVYYELQCCESDAQRLRTMTPADRFALTADLFNLQWIARQQAPGRWQRLDERRWQEKIALRKRMADAYKKLDTWRSERAATSPAG
jgi:hypothetical protein